ncbi:MAG: hypothetical protein U0K60_09700 [Parafannyhessea umbonata]|nr:hypothetical protein [Parafannyhessea umbonata]
MGDRDTSEYIMDVLSQAFLLGVMMTMASMADFTGEQIERMAENADKAIGEDEALIAMFLSERIMSEDRKEKAMQSMSDAVDEILKGVERGDGNAQPEGGR